MTFHTSLAPASRSHVEACRCTGTSPGPVGHVRVRLDLDCGAPLDLDLGYELHGPETETPILVLGGISANHHLTHSEARPAPGWWPGVVGPGAALDPGRHRVLGVEYAAPPGLPGSPATPVTTRDQAHALGVVLDALEIERVALVGASYGGMVGLAFAETSPSRVTELLVLCAAHRTHPMATALRAIQRRIARSGNGGGSGPTAISLGRALAMTTYRSAREFDARFDWRAKDGAGPPRFPVEDYLDARGEDFARRFSPERFATLSESIDLHAVDPSRITVPTTLVSVDSDAVVPPWLVDELAREAPGVRRHVTIESVYGHDAFLKETSHVADVLRATVLRATVLRGDDR